MILSRRALLRSAGFVFAGASLAGCARSVVDDPPEIAGRASPVSPAYAAMYGPMPGERFPVPAVDFDEVDEGVLRRIVPYRTSEYPGTLVIDTRQHALFLVLEGGEALRYGVGVGRQGFSWKGTVEIGSRQKWPRWFPPKEMIAREAARGHNIPDMMEGQIGNPLGARALDLYDGPKDTLFRIHGTFDPKSIGTNASSGCIRMANADVMDLYERVKVGTRVVVR